MKKVFISTLASTIAVANFAVPQPDVQAASKFSDISEKSPLYNDIVELANRGILNGYKDGSFRPNDALTRGQAAKILVNILGLSTSNNTIVEFLDIPSNHVYAKEIAALKKTGIIKGFQDGTFRPNAPITRNQMAKMLVTAFSLPISNAKTPFIDLQQAYQEAVTTLYANGITKGKTAKTFDGQSPVTRGQFAALLLRTEKVASKDLELTVDSIADSKIKTNRGELIIGEQVKMLLNASNKDALKGALLKGKIVNGELQEITSLQLTANGTIENALTFDGGNATIYGPLIIDADFLIVKNVNVNNQLTITSKVASKIELDHVISQGTLQIEAKAPVSAAALTTKIAETSQSFEANLKDSTFSKVNIQRNQTNVTSNKKIPQLLVSGDVQTLILNALVDIMSIDVKNNLNLSGNSTIQNLTLENIKEFTLKVIGEITKFNINNPNSRIDIGTGLTVKELVIPNTSAIEVIIKNWDTIKNNIINVINQLGQNVNQTQQSDGGSSSIPIPLTKEQALLNIENYFDHTLYNYIKSVSEKGYILAPELLVQAINIEKQRFEENALIAGYDLVEYKKWTKEAQVYYIYLMLMIYSSSNELPTQAQMEQLNLQIKDQFQNFFTLLETDDPNNVEITRDALVSTLSNTILLFGNNPMLFQQLENNRKLYIVDELLTYPKSEINNHLTRFNNDLSLVLTVYNKAFDQQFSEQTLFTINDITNLSEMNSALNQYYWLINYTDFALLNDTQNQALYDKVFSQEFTTIHSFQEKFNSQLTQDLQILSTDAINSINVAADEAAFQDALSNSLFILTNQKYRNVFTNPFNFFRASVNNLSEENWNKLIYELYAERGLGYTPETISNKFFEKYFSLLFTELTMTNKNNVLYFKSNLNFIELNLLELLIEYLPAGDIKSDLQTKMKKVKTSYKAITRIYKKRFTEEFKAVFEANAEAAGYDLTVYNRLTEATKQIVIKDLSNNFVVQADFDQFIKKYADDSEALLNALEAEYSDAAVTTFINTLQSKGDSLQLDVTKFNNLYDSQQKLVASKLLTLPKINGSRFNNDSQVINQALQAAIEGLTIRLDNTVETFGIKATSVSTSNLEAIMPSIDPATDQLVFILDDAGSSTITLKDDSGQERKIPISISHNGVFNMLTDAQWQAVDGNTDNLVLTFSSPVTIDNLNLNLAGVTTTPATASLSNDGKILNMAILDTEATATTFTLTGVQNQLNNFTLTNVNIKPRSVLSQVAQPTWQGYTLQWTGVTDADHYAIQFYKDGVAIGSIITVAGDYTSYDALESKLLTDSGHYTATVQAKAAADSAFYGDGLISEQSVPLEIIIR